MKMNDCAGHNPLVDKTNKCHHQVEFTLRLFSSDAAAVSSNQSLRGVRTPSTRKPMKST